MLCPVMPSTDEHNGAWVAGSMDEDVDFEEVKQDEVLLGDKIVGTESVTLDERGPGAREPVPLKAHKRVLQHNLSVITSRTCLINHGVLTASLVDAGTPITVPVTSQNGKYPSLSVTMRSRNRPRTRRAPRS